MKSERIILVCLVLCAAIAGGGADSCSFTSVDMGSDDEDGGGDDDLCNISDNNMEEVAGEVDGGGCGALENAPGSECALAKFEGACAKGEHQCLPDGSTACIQTAFGRKEVCNGIDDDCNGVVDDNPGSLCGQGQTCQSGRCVPNPP